MITVEAIASEVGGKGELGLVAKDRGERERATLTFPKLPSPKS